MRWNIIQYLVQWWSYKLTSLSKTHTQHKGQDVIRSSGITKGKDNDQWWFLLHYLLYSRNKTVQYATLIDETYMYVCMHVSIENLKGGRSSIVAWVFNFTVARFKMGSWKSPRTDRVSSSSLCHLVSSGTYYACYETDFMTEKFDPRMLSRPRHVFLQDIWNENKTVVYNKSSSPQK